MANEPVGVPESGNVTAADGSLIQWTTGAYRQMTATGPGQTLVITPNVLLSPTIQQIQQTMVFTANGSAAPYLTVSTYVELVAGIAQVTVSDGKSSLTISMVDFDPVGGTCYATVAGTYEGAAIHQVTQIRIPENPFQGINFPGWPAQAFASLGPQAQYFLPFLSLLGAEGTSATALIKAVTPSTSPAAIQPDAIRPDSEKELNVNHVVLKATAVGVAVGVGAYLVGGLAVGAGVAGSQVLITAVLVGAVGYAGSIVVDVINDGYDSNTTATDGTQGSAGGVDSGTGGDGGGTGTGGGDGGGSAGGTGGGDGGSGAGGDGGSGAGGDGGSGAGGDGGGAGGDGGSGAGGDGGGGDGGDGGGGDGGGGEGHGGGGHGNPTFGTGGDH